MPRLLELYQRSKARKSVCVDIKHIGESDNASIKGLCCTFFDAFTQLSVCQTKGVPQFRGKVTLCSVEVAALPLDIFDARCAMSDLGKTHTQMMLKINEQEENKRL